MSEQAKIYVAGHRGMVGSAIVRRLQKGAVIASEARSKLGSE
jgi:nucleoside-diphosphate-sugar epimerase